MKFATAVIAAAALLGACTTGLDDADSAEGDSASSAVGNGLDGDITTEELHDHAIGAVEGKTLAFAPAGLGLTLPDEWEVQIRSYAEAMGMEYVLRDSNWDPQQQANTLTSFVNELEPGSVLVVHNSTVSLLASTIEEAEQKGIHVIQLNMASNYKSDAYVATDSIAVGKYIAEDVVEACGEDTSGKVAIVQGDLTSEVALDTMAGWNSVIADQPQIEVVSDQSAAWDPSAAHDIVTNVLQQHPDLCAVWGQFDEMDQGSAQAIREAGLSGEVKLFSYGGSPVTCDLVSAGDMTKAYSFRASEVGQTIASVANYILQSDLPPGTARVAMYVPTFEITPENADDPNICYDGEGSGLQELVPNGG